MSLFDQNSYNFCWLEILIVHIYRYLLSLLITGQVLGIFQGVAEVETARVESKFIVTPNGGEGFLREIHQGTLKLFVVSKAACRCNACVSSAAAFLGVCTGFVLGGFPAARLPSALSVVRTTHSSLAAAEACSTLRLRSCAL